ncbi:MAG: ubiquitin-like small modifier protein SAMP2 [Halococcoides sp.]
MEVLVDVAGGPTHEQSVPDDATFGDLVADLDVSVHEVAILVDGRPRPADATVDAERVRVVRLIKGG